MNSTMFNTLLAAAAQAGKAYTPVEYLECTGTQYIDTGVAPDFAGGDEITVVWSGTSLTGNTVVFGSRTTNVRNGVYLTGSGLIIADGDGYQGLGAGSPLTVNDAEVVAGTHVYTMPRRVTCAFPISLFCLNNGGSHTSYGNTARIYEWTYKRNGQTDQHLIPALVRGVPCMWDTVTGSPLYNAGTGTFVYA